MITVDGFVCPANVRKSQVPNLKPTEQQPEAEEINKKKKKEKLKTLLCCPRFHLQSTCIKTMNDDDACAYFGRAYVAEREHG